MEQALHDFCRGWGVARYQVYWEDLVRSTVDGVSTLENAAVAGIITHSDDEFGVGHGIIGLPDSNLHVMRDCSSNDEYVCVAGRSHILPIPFQPLKAVAAIANSFRQKSYTPVVP